MQDTIVYYLCQVLCVAQSQWCEWDRQNVVMPGPSDGVVRMWSLDYVEVLCCTALGTLYSVLSVM